MIHQIFAIYKYNCCIKTELLHSPCLKHHRLDKLPNIQNNVTASPTSNELLEPLFLLQCDKRKKTSPKCTS